MTFLETETIGFIADTAMTWHAARFIPLSPVEMQVTFVCPCDSVGKSFEKLLRLFQKLASLG